MKPDDKRQTCTCDHRYSDHATGGTQCLAWVNDPDHTSLKPCWCHEWTPRPASGPRAVREWWGPGMSRTETLSPAAVDWLVDGEHGLSSKAMFHRLLLNRPTDRFCYPHDLDDFKRCEMLRRAVPEVRDRLALMAAEGPVWHALVERWDELAASIESEVPGLFEGRGWRNGRARKAGALMRQILDNARGAPA